MSYLGVLRELIRFCDGPSRGASESHVLTDVLANAWPVLNDIASQTSCRTNEAVLSGLLDVHSQLLAVAPALIGPRPRQFRCHGIQGILMPISIGLSISSCGIVRNSRVDSRT